MHRVSLCIAFAAYSASFTIATFAAVTRSAHLSSGETTPDGKITLVVQKSNAQSNSISLRNNDVHLVIVDEYDVSGGGVRDCRGKNVALAAAAVRQICFAQRFSDHPALPTASPSAPGARSPVNPVIVTPEPNFGHASLQVSLSWHQLRHLAIPSPSPSPTPTPTSQ